MSNKLWFVNNGIQPTAVFNEKASAQNELNRYSEDPDFDYYSCYSLNIFELDDYPEEYDLALDRGLIQ